MNEEKELTFDEKVALKARLVSLYEMAYYNGYQAGKHDTEGSYMIIGATIGTAISCATLLILHFIL